MSCELLLSEHDDTESCNDPAHRAAIERREAGAPPWSLLQRQEHYGDFRDYLEGEPIHCGAGLELQMRTWKSDDFGEYILLSATGLLVRYEIEWLPGGGKRPVIHADVGGYGFIKPIEMASMRFRWPKRRDR